jgi:hypothetical protein
VVVVNSPAEGGSHAAASNSTAAGPHSLSLSISTEFEPGWENGKEPRHGGLIKIVGGKSAPPSPLTAGRLLSGGGSRQCATPPVPPRNHHHHHVSTTYINQDRHTLIVTTPESERIAVKEHYVNGGSHTRTLGRLKAEASPITAIKPEIKINLAEPREAAAAVAATVMVVPPVSISITGQHGPTADKMKLREVRLTESS